MSDTAPRPPATPAPGSPSGTTGPSGRSGPSASASRSDTRRRATTPGTDQSGGLGRYRVALLVGALVLGIGVVVFILLQSSGPAYACDSLLTPGPSDPVATAAAPSGSQASPGPAAPTQRLGFTTIDMGREHISANSTTRFAFCPPTSGTHWSVAGLAPIRRDFYSPDDGVAPGSWVHNLEHGYVVIAYKGVPSAADLDAIRAVFEEAPASEVAAQCGMPNKVVALRFDEMSEPFAILSWDRALLMSTFDRAQALTFIEQWQDGPQTPERAC